MINYLISAALTATQAKTVAAGVLMCVIAALSIALIVLVLMQRGSGDNVSAITGNKNSESFYAKTKGGSRQRIMRILTIAFSVAIAVLAIIFFAIVPYNATAVVAA